MKIIYEPKGPALEYANLALNPYKGCLHRCIYCYNNGRFGKKGDFFKGAKPRMGILKDLIEDLNYLHLEYEPGKCPEIQLTFLGDAYQPAELRLGLTRMIIKQIMAWDLPFTILTKSNLVFRDLDILAPYEKFRLGMSFTSIDHAETVNWEPGTGYPQDRIRVLQDFKNRGVKTWVSLEPVMRVASTIKVIRLIHNFVDFFHVGALNHMEPPEPINLPEAHREIMATLEFHHCKYKFKKSFTDM